MTCKRNHYPIPDTESLAPIQIGVDAMVIKFEHAKLSVGEHEEADLNRQVALDLFLAIFNSNTPSDISCKSRKKKLLIVRVTLASS